MNRYVRLHGRDVRVSIGKNALSAAKRLAPLDHPVSFRTSKAESASDSSALMSSVWKRGHRIARILATFFLGQGALQGVNIIAGLYLVRTMSIEAYAQFGLAVGFQQTVGLLMDLGFTSTIIPLVGDQGDNKVLVGKYVRAAKHLRDRTFWILSPIAMIAFFAIMRRHRWSWISEVLLMGSVLLSVYSGGKVSYYSAPLFLYGRLKDFYLPQTLSALGRLGVFWTMRVAGALTGWTAAVVTALNLTLNGEILQKVSRSHVEWPEEDDPKIDREVIRYVLPAIPALVFGAFQLQSSVFLIGIFGQSVSIAQISALSRLSQIFSIFTIFNTVVVEPAMARLPQAKVLSRYIILILIALLACTPIVLVAFLAPGPVLWLLGSKYEGLRDVVGWAMLASSVNYISMLLWIMNRARKWVFWSGTILEISLTLLGQALFIVMHGVRTTHDAVFFSLLSAFGPLLTHIYVMVFGMSGAQPRKIVSSI
jgi:O-antigen/teichoic acid export membrane protein